MSKRTKVLIVEDEIEAITRLYIGLLRMDFIVEVCDRAEEVMQRMNRFKPQILLLSQKLFLPELTRSIKEKFSIPILLMGAPSFSAGLEIDEVLQRPVNLHDLGEKIEVLVKNP